MSIPRFLFACSVALGTLVANPLVAMLGVAPASAQNIVVSAPAPSFSQIEYSAPEGERLDTARAVLARAIPVGARVADARAVLRHAGASCHDARNGRMACAWGAVESREDTMQDVVWTVAVAHDGGTVTDVTVDRNID